MSERRSWQSVQEEIETITAMAAAMNESAAALAQRVAALRQQIPHVPEEPGPEIPVLQREQPPEPAAAGPGHGVWRGRWDGIL